jgi:endoglucanase
VNVTISTLQIPEDDHIAVSIHAYTPYAFTYVNDQASATDVWNGSLTKDITGVMTDLWRVFLAKDIPVLLTEYGAEDKNQNTEEVRKWVVDYVSKATAKGIPCFWWDNGIYSQSGEKFAIFDRNNLSWYREEVVDAIIEESYKQH